MTVRTFPPPLLISRAGNSLMPATEGPGEPHGPEKMAQASCVLGSTGALADSSTLKYPGLPSAGVNVTHPHAAALGAGAGPPPHLPAVRGRWGAPFPPPAAPASGEADVAAQGATPRSEKIRHMRDRKITRLKLRHN